MTDEIDHVATLAVPEWAMAETLDVLRALRSAHRQSNGTSKLTRAGQTLTLRFAGPVDAVLDLAAKLEAMRRKLAHVARLRAFRERLEALVSSFAGSDTERTTG